MIIGKRHKYIELIAQWEGRVTTTHLQKRFGIGRQQASSDLKKYRELVPGNLTYCAQSKGYIPSRLFKPFLISEFVDDYFIEKSIQQNFNSYSFIEKKIPNRRVDPITFRGIHRALVEKRRIDIGYMSLRSAQEEERIIVPHTFVSTPLRWHVRGFCEKNRDFRDFVLSRFRGTPELLEKSTNTIDKDEQWNTMINISVSPNPAFSSLHQEVLAHDFNMTNNKLIIQTRVPLINYTLKYLDIDTSLKYDSSQLLILNNIDEVIPYLFS
tara:strand:+ start:57 stop:860 length:804 start_codon:yes stop_codon:yes gene_type:complete